VKLRHSNRLALWRRFAQHVFDDLQLLTAVRETWHRNHGCRTLRARFELLPQGRSFGDVHCRARLWMHQQCFADLQSGFENRCHKPELMLT
jgi:hypothetical protein